METVYTDAELVAGVLARDAKHITAFVERYTPLIQGAAARILSRLVSSGRRIPDVRDAVQEIFVQLWTKDFAILRHYKSEQGTLGAYLWTVSQNATRRLAAGGSTKEIPTRADALPVGDGPGSSLALASPPELSQVEARDELVVLFAELGPELDPTDRTLIERRFIEELPSDLICAELRLSPAAFYQRISRLRRLIVETAQRLSGGKA